MFNINNMIDRTMIYASEILILKKRKIENPLRKYLQLTETVFKILIRIVF